MSSVKSVHENFEFLSWKDKEAILLYDDSRLDGNKNKFILEADIVYIKSSKRFSGSLFD